MEQWTEPYKWTEPNIHLLDNVALALDFFEAMNVPKHVAVDVETDYKRDAAYVPLPRQNILSIAFAWNPTNVYVLTKNLFTNPMNEYRILTPLRKFLERNRLICQNGKFDLAVLSNIAPDAKLSFDTALAAYALNPKRRSYALNVLAREELNSPDWKKVVPELL